MNVWIAAADNNLPKVKEYLASKLFTANSKDDNGYTPLHAAAEYTHLDLLKYLVEQDGNVNVQDNDGDTPLHACETVEAASVLLDLGAQLDIRNNEGLTPLEKAEEENDFPELIRFLRLRCGKPLDGEESIPENVNLSIGSQDAEIPLQVSEEQRARLNEIIQTGTDADFENYLKEVLGTKAEEAPNKRLKN